MIPPVEVRQVRKCSTCMFHVVTHYHIFCKAKSSQSVDILRSHELNVGWLSTEETCKKYPCKFNINYEEMEELIDEHNKRENENINPEPVIEELKQIACGVYEIEKGDICEIAHERRLTLGSAYVFDAIPRYNGPVTILVIPGGILNGETE